MTAWAIASLTNQFPIDKSEKLDYALSQSITKKTECQSDTLSKYKKSPPKWACATQAILTWRHDAKYLAFLRMTQFSTNHANSHATAFLLQSALCSQGYSEVQFLFALCLLA